MFSLQEKKVSEMENVAKLINALPDIIINSCLYFILFFHSLSYSVPMRSFDDDNNNKQRKNNNYDGLR